MDKKITNSLNLSYAATMAAIPGNILRDIQTADLEEELFKYVNARLDQEIRVEPSGWPERWIGNLARDYYATLKKFTTRITLTYDVTVVAKSLEDAQGIVDNLEYPQSTNHNYVSDSYSIIKPIRQRTPKRKG